MRVAKWQAGWVRLRAVADGDEDDERLAIAILPEQHVGDAGIFGLKVGLLDWMQLMVSKAPVANCRSRPGSPEIAEMKILGGVI